MAAIRDRAAMIRGMAPILDPATYVFVETPPEIPPALLARAVAMVREAEGGSLILRAKDAGGAEGPSMRRITLTVHSSLEGVGLTAAVSTALADAGIACNVVAGARHDHLFVPARDADRALGILERLAASGG